MCFQTSKSLSNLDIKAKTTTKLFILAPRLYVCLVLLSFQWCTGLLWSWRALISCARARQTEIRVETLMNGFSATLIINTLSLCAGKLPQNVYLQCCCCCGSLHLSAGHSHSLHSLSHSPPASKCPLVTVAMGRRTSIFMHLTDSEILKCPASSSRSSQVNLRNILLCLH